MSACVAIVDPFSSGATLASALAERSVRCVAVVSALARASEFAGRFRPEGFAETLAEKPGDDRALIEALARHRPTHVVPGFETGVALADRLAAGLGLPGNDPAGSLARRHKGRMLEAVRAHGLAVASQAEVRDVDAALDWARARDAWPVVVKPPASVASDGVTLCASPDEVRAAAGAILGRPDVLGQVNDTLLVQERLPGREYVVDTVSCGGRARVSGYWVYDRAPPRSRGLGYDSMFLMPHEGPRQRALRDYALAVLDALGIRFGAAHCEVMWTGRGPVLVECAARLTAGNNATLGALCGGTSPIEALTEALLAPERFAREAGPAPRLARRAANVFFLRGEAGRLRDLPGLDTVRGLPTLHRLSVSAREGEPVPRVLGMATLVGDRLRDVVRDVRTIRRLGRGELYRVEDGERGCCGG